MVVDCIARPGETGDTMRETKLVVSSFSRTCKAWLERLRPLLFNSLVLRSHGDLLFLHYLLDERGSGIRDYVHTLEAQQTSTYYPWTHLVCRLLQNRLPRLRSIRYAYPPVDCSFPAKRSPIFQSPVLPVFYSTFQTVTRLSLSGYRFANFGSLVRMVGGFAQLEEVHCDGLSWDSRGFTPQLRQRVHNRAVNTLRLVAARNCPDRWSLLWLFSGSGACQEQSDQRASFLSAEEAPSLIQLAHMWLDDEDDQSKSVTCFELANSQLWAISCAPPVHADDVLRTGSLSVERRASGHTGPVCLYTSRLSADMGRADTNPYIRFIRVTRCYQTRLASLDWPAVNLLFSGLPLLKEVTFVCGFVHYSHDWSPQVSDTLSSGSPTVPVRLHHMPVSFYHNFEAALGCMCHMFEDEDYKLHA